MPRPRRIVLLLCSGVALLIGAGSLRAVTVPGAEGPAAEDQEAVYDARALQRERILALLELWPAAEPERRASALTHLRPDPRRPLPRGAWPTLEALADALRVLRGGPGPVESGGWEQRLADSLSLTVVPGAFEARAEGRRPALTVHLRALFETPLPEGVEVRLLWTSPGGEERVARTEPVEPGPLRRGFEMYVDGPPSDPGEWALVPLILRGGAQLRGFPVAVDAVRDLGRRQLALEERERTWPADHPGRARLGDALALLRRGLRLPALSSEDVLRLAEGEPAELSSAAALPGGLVPASPHFVGGRLEAWLLGPAGSRTGVVLVASSRERAEELLAGNLGQRWLAAAETAGFELFATGLPFVAADGGRSAVQLLAELHAERGWERCCVVALGDAATQSAVALGPAAAAGTAAPAALDLVVLLRDAPAAARPDARLGTTTISIEPLAEEAQAQDLRPEGPPWLRITRREPRFLVELELPELLLPFLSSEGGRGDGAQPAPDRPR